MAASETEAPWAPDDQDLIRHLFAKATACLEDAQETAISGQSPHLTRAEALQLAQSLKLQTGTLAAVAELLTHLEDL